MKDVELVSYTALQKCAVELQSQVAETAPYPEIAQAARISRIEKRKSGLSIGVYLSLKEGDGGVPYARAFDIGSGIHGKFKKKYPILARNAPFLRFAGTNAFKGQIIKVKQVMHPGVKGTGYMKKAKDLARPEITRIVKEDVNKNIRVYLRDITKEINK